MKDRRLVPQLPLVSSGDVERVLARAGFEPAPKRGKGSHRAFVRHLEPRLTLYRTFASVPRATLHP